MQLNNLQLRLHGKAPLEHRITYQNERGTQCRETLCSGEEFAQHVIDCLEAVPELRTERDTLQGTINGLKPLLNELMSDELLDRLGLEHGYTPEQFHVSMKALFNDLSTLRTERDKLLATPLQLNEISYVLHGDIQPCTVLYTDDTTTLLRLEENDMMLETETIEWSDVTTYRCQELLRASQGKQHVSVATVKAVAQLVRDERILLVDESSADSDEELLRSAIKPTLAPLVVPAPPPAAPATPSCGNPYVHDNVAYPEADMRAAGWQTEDLVQNGYGHYAPFPAEWVDNRPAEVVDAERADAFDKFNQELGQAHAAERKYNGER